MVKINADQIRALREKTGAPVMSVKKTLEDVGGDEKKAEVLLRKVGFEKAENKSSRATGEGAISTYVHHSGKVASLVELLCETDFVARNKLFKQLGHDLALQVASMNPKNSLELEKQDFIKDPSKKISELVREVVVKTGENIRIGRIYRIELGQTEN